MRGTLGDRQFTRNDMAFVNGWYKITKGVKVGAEVMYVNTERFDKTDEGMRYTLSMFYNFWFVPEPKLLIFPIFASGLNFNPQNTTCIPVVKICAFLELEKIF